MSVITLWLKLEDLHFQSYSRYTFIINRCYGSDFSYPATDTPSYWLCRRWRASQSQGEPAFPLGCCFTSLKEKNTVTRACSPSTRQISTMVPIIVLQSNCTTRVSCMLATSSLNTCSSRAFSFHMCRFWQTKRVTLKNIYNAPLTSVHERGLGYPDAM